MTAALPRDEPPHTRQGPPPATVLAADVGGTKTWIALFHAEGTHASASLTLLRASKYSSPASASLEQIVREFLRDERETVDFACFGLPGPVSGDRAKLVNLPWEIDATALCRTFGFRRCFLINDLLANAHGIGELGPDDFALLHPGDPGASGNMAVISPGTGLGEAGMFWDGCRHLPFACEGGHCDFAPRTELELALHQHLLQPYGHISFERVLSGSMGIPNIYKFLRDTGRNTESPAVAELLKTGDPGAVISTAAGEASCALCVRTMEIFTTILGAEAGNLALKIMATSGVFIGGGIAAKILPLLRRPHLLEAFFAKGRFSDFMRRIPLRVILNDQAALLGAARYALIGAAKARP